MNKIEPSERQPKAENLKTPLAFTQDRFRTRQFLTNSKIQDANPCPKPQYRELLNIKCSVNKQHKNIMIIIIIYNLDIVIYKSISLTLLSVWLRFLK